MSTFSKIGKSFDDAHARGTDLPAPISAFFAVAMLGSAIWSVSNHYIKHAEMARTICDDYRQQLSSSDDFAKATTLPIFNANNIVMTIPLPQNMDATLPGDSTTCTIAISELQANITPNQP